MTFLKYIKENLVKFIYIISIFIVVNLIIYLTNDIFIENEDLLYLNILLLTITILFILYEYLTWKKDFSKIYKATLNESDLNNININENKIATKIINDIINIKNYERVQDIELIRRDLNDLNDFITLWIHEIKLPISVLELITDQIDDLEEYNISKNLRIEIERMNFLINQVLYTSRITDFSKDLYITEVDLNNLVSSVIKENKNILISKNINLDIDKTNSTIYTDKKWAYFVINQILNNSAKYTKDFGNINITFKEDSNRIHLIIKDDGIGISKSDINRIYDKGFTGKSGVHFQKSTGMGLYLSKKVSKKLNFTINAKSKENLYTEFTISFNKMNPYFNVTKM